MRAQTLEHMFHHLSFQKTADEITAKVEAKIKKLREKIEERTLRVKRLRDEHGIDDAALIQLLTDARKAAQHPNVEKMSYSFSSNSAGSSGSEGKLEEKTIGAGVVNHLLTENDFIEAEKEQVKRLELIARNLKPLHHYSSETGVAYTDQYFQLSYDELKYLDF